MPDPSARQIYIINIYKTNIRSKSFHFLPIFPLFFLNLPPQFFIFMSAFSFFDFTSSFCGTAFFFRIVLPRFYEAHFSGGLLFRDFMKPNFLADYSSEILWSAFFCRTALARSEEAQLAGKKLSIKTRRSNLLAKCSCSE